MTAVVDAPATVRRRRLSNSRAGLPAGSPPRFPKVLPRGPQLWTPDDTLWTEDNTDGHWQDNRPEYFLNPATCRAHLTDWANLGVIGILWGAGAEGQSHYYDANNDGITNPPPINGNDAVSVYPDDDGGYVRLQLSNYYSSPLPLPDASAP